MRHSTELKYRTTLKDMAFCRLQKNFVINMVKKEWILQQNKNRCCKNCFQKSSSKNF